MADGNGSSSTTELAVPSGLARLNYFYGQLLAQADLKAEQSYHVLLRRLVQRETFGTGTVAGLRVRPADPVSIAPRGVFVEAGLAIDPAGRELLLESAQCVDVADAEIPPKGNGIPSDATVEEMADELNELTERSIDFFDVIALANRLHGAGMDEVDEMSPPFAGTDENASLVAKLNQIAFPTSLPVPLAPAQTLADWLFDALVGTTYVGVRYLERGSAVAPALLDGSCCDSQCHPTRIAEGLTIVRSSTPFPPPESAYEDARTAFSEAFVGEDNDGVPAPSPPVIHSCDASLSAYLLDAWRGLPARDAPCASTSLVVVPLARVYWARYPRGGSEPRILEPIENATFRPLAPSPVVVRALFDVVTQCASPVAIAPFFESIEPAIGARLEYSIAATEVRITAKATGPLALNIVAPTTKGWSVDFHPDDGSAPAHWGEVPAPSAPYPSGITTIEIYVDGADNRIAGLKITKPANVELPNGTYVWRVNMPTVTPTPASGDWALRSKDTLIGVDGEPRPPTAVPSGDGKPGGVFEARFYVSND